MIKGLIKNRIVISSLFVGICCLIHTELSAQTIPDAITSGATQLLEARYGESNWVFNGMPDPLQTEFTPDDFVPTYTRDSIASIEGLLSSGIEIAKYDTAIDWLEFTELQTTYELSQKIIILTKAGRGTTEAIEKLMTALNADNGFGGSAGYRSDILSTAAALKALVVSGSSDDSIIFGAANYLLSSQNPDGGWGFITERPSNPYFTAIVLEALYLIPAQYFEDALATADAYLVLQQNPDGGFGYNESSVKDTALALMGLAQSRNDISSVTLSAIDYLLTTQSLNGSWNDDPYSTALALRALAHVKPNLSVTSDDIIFNPSNPTIGDALTLTANVKNSGLDAAGPFTVVFYNGNPDAGGLLIGDVTVPSLAVGESLPVTITSGFAEAGGRTIYVSIDTENVIDETSETDNVVSRRLWVSSHPDLAVFSSDLIPSSYTPVPAETFMLEYKVRNLGESETGPFTAILYDGDPTKGGTPVSSVNISGINGAAMRSGTISVTLLEDGPHELWFVADTSGSVLEKKETNNTASSTVQVGGSPTGVDLAVTAAGITAQPLRPDAGDSVNISATVMNQAAEPSGNFTVDIFDGLPESGGTLIHSGTLSLDSGASGTITADWTISEGIHDIYVVVDRANSIVESSEANNLASIRIMTDMVDIAISASGMAFSPEQPVMGDVAALSIDIRNVGIRDTGLFTTGIYDGDPDNGGVLVESFTTASIPGDGSVSHIYTFTAEARTYRFYVVADGENVVAEYDEFNNMAINSLTVKGPGETFGPDIVPFKIDVSDVTTDPNTLETGGAVEVTIHNKGDEKIETDFEISIFDDVDLDGRYTKGVDTLLGIAENTSHLWPGGANMLSVPLAGSVRFLGVPLYAFVDSGDMLAETGEGNNVIRSGEGCELRPEKPIEPVLEWSWKNSYTFASPLVLNMTDDNGDGLINDRDIPDILTQSTENDTRSYPYRTTSRLWALSGDSGEAKFSIFDLDHLLEYSAPITAGDLDNDGLPEIIAYNLNSYGVQVYENDGTLKWDNTSKIKEWNDNNNNCYDINLRGTTPVIADLDADGNKEIIMGTKVFNSDGSIKWIGANCYGTGQGSFNRRSLSTVVDLDLDGKQELVAGNVAYNHAGEMLWWNKLLTDGSNAVGNFDDDAFPEIVLVSNYNDINHPRGPRVYLLEHDGTIKWGPVYVHIVEDYTSSSSGTAPVIYDFDGDGEPEILIKGRKSHVILDKNGQLKNTIDHLYKWGAGLTASPEVFDLNGDGRPEIIDHSSNYLRIFDGIDGTLLFEDEYINYANDKNILASDVDGDGQVELVVLGWDRYKTGDALRIYGSKNNDWVDARSIWNQFGYHVTNVNDDGSIPQHESPSWLLNNTYRVQMPIEVAPPNPYATPDLTVSYLRLTDDSLKVRIGNGGANAAEAGLSVAFYEGDPVDGGILLGTVLTMKVLTPGEFEDVVLPLGSLDLTGKDLYAIADPEGSISECNISNNSVFIENALPVNEDSGTDFVDLYLTGEDIVLPEGSHYAGSLIPVKVRVHNSGTVAAQNIPVKLTLGDPSNGGIEIDSGSIAALEAGGSATVEFIWDSLGQDGSNYLYAWIDPENVIDETLEENNLAIKAVDLAIAQLPELIIESFTFSALSPQEGDSVTIEANIQNKGVAVGNIQAQLYLGDPKAGGVPIGSVQSVYQTVPTGGLATVTWYFDTVGKAGANELYAVVDPQDMIAELNEDNNISGKTVVVRSAGISTNLSTGAGDSSANEDVLIELSVTNTGSSAATVNIDVSVEDMDGNKVLDISTVTGVILSAGEVKGIEGLLFNTGRIHAGSYRLHARVIKDGQVVSRAYAEFSIVAVIAAESAIVTDKMAYGANEQIELTSTVASLSPNSTLAGLEAFVSIVAPDGSILFSDSSSIADLLPDARIDFKSYAEFGSWPGGLYRAVIEIRSSDQIIANSFAEFEILSSLDQGKALSGTVRVTPSKIFETETVSLSYTLRNIGNKVELPLIKVEILVVDPETEEVLRTIEDETALSGREVYSRELLFDSRGLAPKNYMIVVMATAAGITQTLDSIGLIIEEIPNHAPLADAGTDQAAFAGQPLLLDGSLSSDPDEDPLTFNWYFVSLPEDSTISIESIDSVDSMTPSFVPDVEGVYVVGLLVNDGLTSSPEDRVSLFINPRPAVDVHPETISLKSKGGANSITCVLSSPSLSAFEFFTLADGVTVNVAFVMENSYIDKDGREVLFTIGSLDYDGDDIVKAVDTDDSGIIDEYRLTLKFDRDQLIAGFTDAGGELMISKATDLLSTINGNDLAIGSDINSVILPPEISRKGK